ncbi:MAG: cysteine hydrolase family protein [Candidatus Cryosericum sp.]
MGIEHVVICGLFTDQCVFSTVRNLSDWGCTVFLVEDATSAINADLQVWETRMLNQIYSKVVSTEEVLQDLAGQ